MGEAISMVDPKTKVQEQPTRMGEESGKEKAH